MPFTQPPQKTALPPLLPLGARPRREDIDRGRVVLIHGALSPRECRNIIHFAEVQGFQPAGLAIGDDRYRVNAKARNNARVILEDSAFAKALSARVRGLLEPRHERLKLDGLNWRLRIYRYQPGQYFRPHLDVRMGLPGGGETRCSMMIYLNDDFTGGETTFFERKPKGRAKSRKRNNRTTHIIRPVTGAALAFDHLLLHEGSEVTDGVKYAIRTDVIYR
ncbi:MAG: 2OG-Fe(II) oxygenase [Myxococcota bacterium]